MREIKFRAWDRINHKVIEMPTLHQGMKGVGIVEFYDVDQHKTVRPVKPGIFLMQFTGLKDKNGKEIYEGDILSYPKHEGYYLMKWICDSAEEVNDCGFTCERDAPSYNYMLPSIWKRMEVIGNIYENPELQKGKSKERIVKARQDGLHKAD